MGQDEKGTNKKTTREAGELCLTNVFQSEYPETQSECQEGPTNIQETNYLEHTDAILWNVQRNPPSLKQEKQVCMPLEYRQLSLEIKIVLTMEKSNQKFVILYHRNVPMPQDPYTIQPGESETCIFLVVKQRTTSTSAQRSKG